MNKYLLTVISLMFISVGIHAQKLAVQTNLLYGAVAYTPNLSLAYGLGDCTTLNFSVGYNPWNINNTIGQGEKLAHWIIQPEFRYWSCERFDGHFFGMHGIYSGYNIGGKNLPMLFGEDSENYRYEGISYGGGFSYGYNLALTPRFAVEFELGAGFMHLAYDQYYAFKYGKFIQPTTHNYFGVTKAGISLVWNLF